MDGIMSRLSQDKDATVVKVSLYEDRTKADSNGDKTRASVTLDENNPHTVYIVIDKNGAPPEQTDDDDLAIVFEKRVLSTGSQNAGTGSIASEEKGPEEETLKYFKCNVCWTKKLEREDDYFAVTLCGHVFCSKCKDNILSMRSKRCPLCKRHLQPASFVKIYA